MAGPTDRCGQGWLRNANESHRAIAGIVHDAWMTELDEISQMMGARSFIAEGNLGADLPEWDTLGSINGKMASGEAQP